jgi:hypothetical protein
MIKSNILFCPKLQGWLVRGIEAAQDEPKERAAKMYPERYAAEPMTAERERNKLEATLDTSVGTAFDCCPRCGHPFNRAFRQAGQREPQANDLTICVECTKLLIFTDDIGHVRSLTIREMGSLIVSRRSGRRSKECRPRSRKHASGLWSRS